MKYFYQVQVYKAGDVIILKCGQIRVWTTKFDVIYFSKNFDIQPVLALRCNKTIE